MFSPCRQPYRADAVCSDSREFQADAGVVLELRTAWGRSSNRALRLCEDFSRLL